MSRRRWTSPLASLLLAASLGGCAGGAHPAVGVLAAFEPAGRTARHLNPYFANLYALELLERGGDPAPVRDYLAWYLSALNYPDKHGLTGTVYDRDLHHGGREAVAERYDSADSYAATFLELFAAYVDRTGDESLLRVEGRRVLDVAWLLVALQDPDGLVRALPDGDTRYLMDNCEVYSGLLAGAALADRLAPADTLAARLATRLRTAAGDVRDAVLELLWRPETDRFDWADAAGRRHASRWEVLYPDAFAQLFPVLHGLVDHDAALGQRLWHGFADRYDPPGDTVSPAQRLIIERTRERMERP